MIVNFEFAGFKRKIAEFAELNDIVDHNNFTRLSQYIGVKPIHNVLPHIIFFLKCSPKSNWISMLNLEMRLDKMSEITLMNDGRC